MTAEESCKCGETYGALRLAACEGAMVSASSRRLLMVDDERSIIEGLTQLLEDEGIEVASVTTGEAAADAADRFRPDVILMDITLPGINGLEAYRRVRRNHPQVPFVFATGHGDGNSFPEVLADSRTRFLHKPYDFSTLLDAIAELETLAPVTLE